MLMRFFAALTALLSLLTGLKTPESARCAPVVTGSFLQCWYCAGWNDARWAQEAAYMKEAGLEYLVLQTTASQDDAGVWTVYYPSHIADFGAPGETDVIGLALKHCKAQGIKVFIGLADYAGWWGEGAFSQDYFTVCSLMTEMQREIYAAYRPAYGDTLYGWYFPPEIDNVLPMKLSVTRIAKGLNLVLDTATALDGTMPVMLSPYFSETYAVPSVLATLPMWQTFFETARFRPGDIFAPQDAVGAGWTREEHLEKVWQMYRAAVDACDKGVLLWANCENFTSAAAGNVPADMERFARQLKLAAKYTDNIISFSMNHFYSPFTDADAYGAYLSYLAELG